MSAISDSKGMTADQLANVSDDGQRRELLNGVIHMMSPAGGRHGQVALKLGRLLGAYVDANGLGVVFAAETGFILSRNPDTVRAPDVGFVRQVRFAALDDISGFLPLAPDLVAEVISPNDRYSEVEEKAACWMKSGVHAVLLVDPVNRTVQVCRSPAEIVLLDESAELVINDVVPGWRLKLADLFQ